MRRRRRTGRAAVAGRVPRGDARRQAVHVQALSAVYDQHAATGSQPQAGLHGPPDDAGGPKPVRERPHHLHAYRLDQSGHGGRSRRPASWSLRNTAASICPTQPRQYQTKVKNAQEAHEAIRPAGHPFAFPEELRGELNSRRIQALRPDLEADRRQPDGRRPRPADHDRDRRRRGRVPGRRQDDRFSRLSAGLCRRQRRSAGRTGRAGYRAADRSRWANGSSAVIWSPRSHTTQPPARYSEAALTRALEEMGIGRPSTYASIIDTILAREYVFKKGNALVPTWVAFAVAQLLSDAPAEPGRLSVHGPDGRRSRRHQPRRDRATSTTCASFISATARRG